MKVVRVIILWSLCWVLAPKGATAQYIAHFTESDHIKNDTLIDRLTCVKFIIDKSRIYITAIDKNRKMLWRTDPAIDNKLEKYRVKRPKIVYYVFGIDNKGQQVIKIVYDNSQSGYLDKKSGKFVFIGQD